MYLSVHRMMLRIPSLTQRKSHLYRIFGLYHYKTYAPGSYLTGPSKEAKDFRVEIEDVILKNCHAMFVCGREVTGGMQVQITKAKVLNIPIYRVVEGKKGVIITMYVEQEKKYV